jgi:hypothetical protein
MPTWVSLKVRSESTWPLLAAAVLVGLMADQWLRTGTFGLAASLTIAVIAVAMIATGVLTTRSSRLLALGGLAFAAWLTLRASPWLLWPDLAASLVLLGLSASLALRGSVADMGVAEAAARAVHALAHGLAGTPFIVKPLLRARGRVAMAAPIARGLLIAAPIALLLALSRCGRPDLCIVLQCQRGFRTTRPTPSSSDGCPVAAGLLRPPPAEPDGSTGRLVVESYEGCLGLAVRDARFAAFAVAQALGATGAASQTLQAAGVTYADYARSGFFELLWVAGIAAVVIIVFSRITRLSNARSRRSFAVLAEVGIALTLLIVFVAFRRLSFYEEAFGFTMLRLYSHIFAVWIAVVFLLFAVDIAGNYGTR